MMIVVEIRFAPSATLAHRSARPTIDRRSTAFRWHQFLEAWRFARSARRLYGARNVRVRWL